MPLNLPAIRCLPLLFLVLLNSTRWPGSQNEMVRLKWDNTTAQKTRTPQTSIYPGQEWSWDMRWFGTH